MQMIPKETEMRVTVCFRGERFFIKWNFKTEQHKSAALSEASWSAPVARLLVGRGIHHAEHVPPDKRQEVLQRAEWPASMAVM